MLIEQLIFGMDSKEMCAEIISKNPISFKEAFDIAHTLETVHKTSTTMKTTNSNIKMEATNKLGYEPNKSKKNSAFPNPKITGTGYKKLEGFAGSCHGCGGKHMRDQCKFKEATCFVCGKKGYISKSASPKRSKSPMILIIAISNQSDKTTKLI